MSNENYLGNPNLFKAHTKKEYTEHEIREIAKCMDDPIYFIKTYIKIVNIDEGLVPLTCISFRRKWLILFIIIDFLFVNFLGSLVNQLQS